MRKLLYILIAMCIIFTSCKNRTQTPTETAPNTEEITVTGISCSGHYNEIAYLDIEYVPSNNVTVTAKLSNGENLDVTNIATFDCDTSVVGETNVTVSYDGFSVKYKVIVQVLKLMYISADTNGKEIVYNTGDSFKTEDIEVNAFFVNGSVSKITNYSYYFIKDGYNRLDLNVPGFYTAIITYYYELEKFETQFSFEVTGEPVDYTYTNIELDTTYVKKDFYEEEFEYNNLIVLGSIKSVQYEEIKESDYEVLLYKGENLVEKFMTNGEYTVKVKYKGDIECVESDEATYKVQYRTIDPTLMTINFEYSIKELEGYSVRVKKNIGINPLEYLVIPDGYAFAGFEKYDWNNLSEDTKYIINLDRPASGKVIISFLNNDYTLFYKLEYVKNISVQVPLENPKYKGEGEANFIKWDLKDELFADESKYILPIFEKMEIEVSPIVSIDAINNIRIQVPHTFEELSEINIQLYESTGAIVGEEKYSDNAIFKNLQFSKTYIVKGYIVGVGISGNVKVNIIEHKFTPGIINKITNKTPYKSLMILQNEVSIDTSYYRDNVDGYNFDGFVLKDIDDNIIKDVIVSKYDYRIIINELIVFKEYKLYGKYSDEFDNDVLVYYINFQTYTTENPIE